MSNVKPIQKSFGVDTLWPKRPWRKVWPALMLNVPETRGKQVYHFCVKPDLNAREHKDAVQMCITIQSVGHVGFMPTQMVKADERIADYVGTHRARLRDIANTLDDNTVLLVVGKLTKHQGRETFIVYYLIENGRVILDSVTIRSKLHPKGTDFEDFLLSLGHYTIVEAEVDAEAGVVKCEEFDKDYSQISVLGFPISNMESRGPNETPIMTTTVMHMRFMSFTFNGAAA